MRKRSPCLSRRPFKLNFSKTTSDRPKILVTGGAGFLGSHLVDALIARGNGVIVIDDLSTGSMANLREAIATGFCSFVYADLNKVAPTLPKIVADAGGVPMSQIFHLASPASPEAYEANQWGTLAINGPTTMAIIELAVAQGADLVYSSTSEIYGDPLVHPQPESYFGNVDPIGPRSCYDEGKRFGEAAVAAGVRTMGLNGKIVRFFNCYGPRMQIGDGRLIPSALDAMAAGNPFPVQGTGKQTRSMTYVEDAIEALLFVAGNDELILKPFNIGNDDERTVEEILSALAIAADVPFDHIMKPARPGDPQRRRPDLTFARANGWNPTPSLEDGLAKTLAWFRSEQLMLAK